jgi:hypothetical protein
VTNDELRLRPTCLNGDPPAPDDFEVFWRDIPVGRILKQPGAEVGKPNWWGVNFDQRPQTGNQKGIGTDLADCQQQFRAAWATMRPGIIERFRRHETNADKRTW